MPNPRCLKIDARAARIASEWHSGGESSLYALASTGALRMSPSSVLHEISEASSAAIPAAYRAQIRAVSAKAGDPPLREVENCSSPAAWLSPQGKVVCVPSGSTHAKVAFSLLRGKVALSGATNALLKKRWTRKAWSCEWLVENYTDGQKDSVLEDAARDGCADEDALIEERSTGRVISGRF